MSMNIKKIIKRRMKKNANQQPALASPIRIQEYASPERKRDTKVLKMMQAYVKNRESESILTSSRCTSPISSSVQNKRRVASPMNSRIANQGSVCQKRKYVPTRFYTNDDLIRATRVESPFLDESIFQNRVKTSNSTQKKKVDELLQILSEAEISEYRENILSTMNKI